MLLHLIYRNPDLLKYCPNLYFVDGVEKYFGKKPPTKTIDDCLKQLQKYNRHKVYPIIRTAIDNVENPFDVEEKLKEGSVQWATLSQIMSSYVEYYNLAIEKRNFYVR